MPQSANSAPFWQQFFRNTGLGIFNDIRIRRHGHSTEQKKVVINTSRWTALGRCGVHILPVMVSISIIILNVRQTYIGVDFISSISSETLNIALLQTAAKLQELLIIASLATIVYQLLRDELLYGDGLPLGLLGAGIDFTKLSFFWSPEVFGGVKTLFRGTRKYRKIQLGLFLLLAGAIALLAGPASAVLLVPRKQDWPAGGTYLPLSDHSSDIWPVNLTADSSSVSLCTSDTATNLGFCPSGGYRSLWSHYANLDHSNFLDVIPPFARDLSGNRYYWSTYSPKPISLSTVSLGIRNNRFSMIHPHLSISVLLQQLMEAWWTSLLNQKKLNRSQIEDRQAVSSKVPCSLVNVQCGPAEKLVASDYSISFPTLDSKQPTKVQELSESTLPHDPVDLLQFTWVQLPEIRDAVTTGAVFQSPWEQSDKSRLVVGCSIQAKWVPAQLRMEAYNFWQGWYPKNITYESAFPTKGYKAAQTDRQNGRDAISVDASWLEMLTPSLNGHSLAPNGNNRTTIESILDATRIADGFVGVDESRIQLLESVIGSVFADGLARVNSHRLYTGDPSLGHIKAMAKKKGFEKLLLEGKRALEPTGSRGTNDLRVDFAISGLSYRLTLVQKLAMIVLCLHTAVAIAHTIWIIGRKKSSASWDSVTEILVLAQNSQPAYKALQNTAAGVQHSKTFAKKVVIRPTKLPSEHSLDHLEFIVDEETVQADNELKEMQATNEFPTITSDSVEEHVASSRGSGNVPQASTWPTYRRHSNAPSLWSSSQPAERPISTTDLPLLEPAVHASSSLQHPLSRRVEDGHAYG